MKHPYTSGHSIRVSRYALAIALAMKLSHDQVTLIKWAALIHDIGKINVSRFVLNKRAKLNYREYGEIKKHPGYTGHILGLIPSLHPVIPIAANHHEHFDGSGYPAGLKGKEIPIGARIVAACDAFDAMTANRPYRIPLAPRSACREIKRCSGKHFDPEVVRVALPLFCNLSL
jgi:putative nucleotidyltransferase with HDIG domain